MENARNQESGNRDFGNSASVANLAGNANADGGSVRTNDGNKSPIDVGNTNGQIGTKFASINDDRGISGNSGVTITDGFYFTPRGTIERIPTGHYIGSDGRLRKRRQQRRDTSNADGNARENRSSSDQYQKEFTSEDFLHVDKPLNVRGGKRSRKAKIVKEETSKLTMVTMLASGAAAIFTSVSLLTKHDHWQLQTDEAQILAEALNDAIATLPEKQYAKITGIVETWIPWINLCFVVGAIIVPRFEASAKRVEKKHTEKDRVDNTRNAPTEDNTFSNWSSLGYNQ